VVLGGGVFRSNDHRLHSRIKTGIEVVAPKAVIRKLKAPPVLGAALMGLDEVGATRAAKARLRATLTDVRLSRLVTGKSARPT
jgi:hypothetical protein